MNWYDIEPKDALDIDCRTRPDLNPPVNSEMVDFWDMEHAEACGLINDMESVEDDQF